ncbi:MAG: 4-hydroxyphenylacetate 3-monooxygenase, oxygenase component [Alphaproteobacteria bacterium]|nr:4-hydroxyphenylacetate 3-monooxygenase, oxygenase component [Alphaproteobacteria bacterium]
MTIRTAQQYLDSLKDDRDVWIEGERVADVTSDPRFAGAAQTMADLLQMQHDPELSDLLTYPSPTTGERVGKTHLQPRSRDDLVARSEAIKAWMDATCGMLGRSPDYKNVLVSSWAAAADAFTRPKFDGAANMRAYHEYVRDNDLVMTHVLVNPQVDRSKPAHLEASDVTSQIVEETDAGIVIRGARMVATLGALANELVVMPAASRWATNDTLDTTAFSFGFAIPIATPGLRLICRPPVAHLDARSAMDHPLSLRYDESDSMVIFDNVLVPWERVFIHRDPDFDSLVYRETYTLHALLLQSVIRAASKAEFMMALALSIARSTKIDQHVPVQVMLAETISIADFARTCRVAAEAEAQETPFGTWVPNIRPLQTWQTMFWKMYARQCEIIQTLGAGGFVAVPSYAEVAGDMAGDVERYFQSANADANSRVRLMRLAFDAALSSFAGRQKLYEQYYTGDPMRTQAMLFSMFPKDPHLERIQAMLDDLEARQSPAGSPAGFRMAGE